MTYDPRVIDLARKADSVVATRVRSSRSIRRANPLCGDEVDVELFERDGVIDDVRVETRGCAIVRASGALMRDALVGRDPTDAAVLADDLIAGITSGAPLEARFSSLDMVRLLPARRRCAVLPWEAARALGGRDRP